MVTHTACFQTSRRLQAASALQCLLLLLAVAVGNSPSASGAEVAKTAGITASIPTAGPIGAKYAILGGPSSVLGAPISTPFPAGGGGSGQDFAFGSVYWSPATGAQEVHGAIRDLWRQLGSEQGFLGYPLTDETPTPDGIGRYNRFQGGSIYWSPGTGAHEVHGAILSRYLGSGAESGPFGWPTSDETSALGGRVSTFTGADLWWSVATGTHEVHGAIRLLHHVDTWLGLPTTDEVSVPGGRASTFATGRVSWSEATGAH